MSIEHLSDISKVLIEQCPFTQIPNNIITHIKDNDAFRLYSYLISKSRDWVVVKEYAAKQCGIGEKKARQCWSYFARCGLTEYVIVKDEKGRIIKHDIVVLIGLKFDKDVPFKPVDNSTGAKTASVVKVHRGKNPPSGQSTRVDFAPLLNKEITNKEKTTKQREGIRAKRSPLSDDFKPDKAIDSMANEVAVRCGISVDQLLYKFKNVMRSSARTSADWNAELAIFLSREKPTVKKEIKIEQEVKQTTKFWEPGNPDYDRVHGVSSNGSATRRDNTGRTGVQKAQGYFLQG